jgi:nitrate reductase cytochrome c-type subunit
VRVSHESPDKVVGPRHPVAWWRWIAAALLLVAMTMGVRVASTRATSAEAAAGKTVESDATIGSATRFAVTIRRPSGPPRVDTGLTDPHGNRITVSCSTCHATRTPNRENVTAKDLDEFHGELTFSHGSISCLSCHNPEDYDALKLADGQRVEFSDVMTLCAQCHGPQMQAYEHGAHGGMTGHWDLTRGPRTRNNCVDCHSPHAPQFPRMRPTFKPYDRFLEPARTKH